MGALKNMVMGALCCSELKGYMLLCAALVDSGEGIKVITASLERLRADKGVAAAKDAWTTTGLSLLDFVPKVGFCSHY